MNGSEAPRPQPTQSTASNREPAWAGRWGTKSAGGETVADRATFQDPHQYPAGIDFVIINGVVAVDDGVFEDVRAGRVLRR